LFFLRRSPITRRSGISRNSYPKPRRTKLSGTNFQKQLEGKGLKIRNGLIQDATFITADPGHASANTHREDDAKTRRNKEGRRYLNKKE